MLPMQKKLIGINYTEGNITPKYIVIHETANKNKGSNALAHYRYWNTNQAAKSSAHFVVDDKNILQLVLLEDTAWHVGDNRGRSDISNRNSIGIEICVNEDGDYEKARQNAIDLIRYLLEKTGMKPNQVVRHFDSWGKWCPANMLDKPELWKAFKEQISKKEEEPMESKKSWQQELGEKAIDELAAKGLLSDPAQHKSKDLQKPIESWLALELINRTSKK